LAQSRAISMKRMLLAIASSIGVAAFLVYVFGSIAMDLGVDWKSRVSESAGIVIVVLFLIGAIFAELSWPFNETRKTRKDSE
jgi:predicted transporter